MPRSPRNPATRSTMGETKSSGPAMRVSNSRAIARPVWPKKKLLMIIGSKAGLFMINGLARQASPPTAMGTRPIAAIFPARAKVGLPDHRPSPENRRASSATIRPLNVNRPVVVPSEGPRVPSNRTGRDLQEIRTEKRLNDSQQQIGREEQCALPLKHTQRAVSPV